MKHFIVVTLLIVAARAKLDPKVVNELMDALTAAASKCSDEIKPSSEDIAKLLDHEVPESHEGKCMILCVNKKLGFEKEDGKIDFEKGAEALNKVKESDLDLFNKIHDIYKKCEASDYFDANDPCETSANLASCGINGAKEAGISFDLSTL